MKFSLVEQVQWEDDIIWDDAPENTRQPTSAEEMKEMLARNQSIFPIANTDIDDGDWVDRIIWSPSQVHYHLILIIRTH